MPATPVTNPPIPPRNVVGYLAMRWSTGGWAYGTGALIDPFNVLTCSHNLVDSATDPPPRGAATAVRFYPGYNQNGVGNPPPGGIEAAVGIFANAYFTGAEAWDVGVVRLKAPFAALQYFTPTVTGAEIIGEDVFVTGYPGPRNGEMWEDLDQVAAIDPATNTLLYTHDTWRGNSGSPTWTYDGLSDVTRQHAIHVSREFDVTRRGVLITADVKQWIDTAAAATIPPGMPFFLQGL